MFSFRAKLARTAVLLLSGSLSVTMNAVPATRSHAHALTEEGETDWSELSSSMEAMHRSMVAVHASKDSDLNFVNLMLPHHQAAIDMAKAQLKYGTDPQMRRLAQEIVTDQQSEIELMRLWLKHHNSGTKSEPK